MTADAKPCPACGLLTYSEHAHGLVWVGLTREEAEALSTPAHSLATFTEWNKGAVKLRTALHSEETTP